MTEHGGRLALAALAWAFLGACRVGQEHRPSGPYVLVLGTAQDGGLPQIGCPAEPCARARRDPRQGRLVTSLLLCDPRAGMRWLFDCTPDVEAQLARADSHPARRVGAGPRPPLFEGLFLTHAHMGHYGGLLELGREAYAVRAAPTWLTPRFAAFLRTNGPWSLLVEEQRLVLNELALDGFAPGAPVELAQDLSVRAFRVPHRDEFSDTVGFELRGPRRTLAYLPDIDKWEAWDAVTGPGSVEALLARCDVALLDGSFFADGEVPGRSMKEISHPFIVESLARFASLPERERAKVRFTHLNHTNPAADPASAARRAIEKSGMRVLEEGEILEL
jgi:pyrroloquinoline quinone biosynthesis protein B